MASYLGLIALKMDENVFFPHNQALISVKCSADLLRFKVYYVLCTCEAVNKMWVPSPLLASQAAAGDQTSKLD